MRRLFGLLPLLLLGQAGAASCAFQSFQQALKWADAVALVEVQKYLPQTVNGYKLTQEMQVKVIKAYVGQLAPTLTIRGDNGMAPYPYVTSYPLGTRWIIPLSKKGWPDGRPLPANVFTPVACAGMGLMVSGPVAYGVLYQVGRSGIAEPIALNAFPDWLKGQQPKK